MLFLEIKQLIHIQQRTIVEQGGTPGLRDNAALESAALAVQNRYYYENANVIACAATYAYHLSQAHAFVDGNKRIAALATEIFLLLNGVKLKATNDEIATLFLGIAASEISRAQIEQQLATLVLTQP